ncbi:DeoR/GlpR transcriptional regulator [Pseudoalteromonas sp. K222D]|uniref:transcriptional repressor AgaR n=1 Tax=Pseudoalteromonas TaxID=53246 RepID=UPI001AD6BB04|nr:transcriptional repressor AgaR [Pseudoalteromonas sp. K222D]MBO7926862.1 DeoR/GlpR transcriptional regulator [Pseudoalteromonas sp. K222D]
MLNTIERRQEIIKQVNVIGRVDVTNLAQEFKVSTVTIRTDLNDLDKKRLLVRSRGGAVAISKMTKELSVKEKHSENSHIKQKLAAEAAKLINNNELIILDSGTTTEEVAKLLNSHENLVVMTNGLNIATELAHFDSVEVLMTGGTLRRKSLSFYGRQAETSLTNLRFDKVILGVDGIEFTSGLTTHFEHEASLNRLMCGVAKEVIVVADSSKFDRSGFHIITPLNSIKTLITDNNIPKAYKEYFESLNIKLIIVDVN